VGGAELDRDRATEPAGGGHRAVGVGDDLPVRHGDPDVRGLD